MNQYAYTVLRLTEAFSRHVEITCIVRDIAVLGAMVWYGVWIIT